MQLDPTEPRENPTLLHIIQNLDTMPYETKRASFQVAKRSSIMNRSRRNSFSIGNASRDEAASIQKSTERNCIMEMSRHYVRMVEQLEYFKYDKQDFEDLHDYKEAEILMTNRFIKKEVIDMADLLEEMSEIIINQNKFLSQVAASSD